MLLLSNIFVLLLIFVYSGPVVPSQCILFKTITSKGVMSIATKVAIQMNCKVGGAPWGVEIPIQVVVFPAINH